MKKLYPFLYVIISLFALAVPINAHLSQNPATDPEKIYLFDSHVTVNTNGTIQVVENITVNVKHLEINHGIFRDIPLLAGEQITPIRLELDGQKHPFSTKSLGDTKRFYFGSSDYLVPEGAHTYTFTYTFTGAFRFHENYNEIYWNVNGNKWIFPTDKVQVQVVFPDGVHVMENGISLYTGKEKAKDHHARQTGDFTFETTQSLAPQEGFTISIPFEKGLIKQPAVSSSLLALPGISLVVAVALSISLFIYFLLTWLKTGKDPSYTLVAQYEPPSGISPAFMSYLNSYKQMILPLLSCAILHLAMEKYIEIKQKDKETVILTLLNKDTDSLPVEERIIVKHLFSHGTTHTLQQYSSFGPFKAISSEIKQVFEKKGAEYISENTSYINFVSLFVFVLAALPCVWAVLQFIVFTYSKHLLPLKQFFISSNDYDIATGLISCAGVVLLFLLNMIILGVMKNNNDKPGAEIGCLLGLFVPFLCIAVLMQGTWIAISFQIIFLITVIGFGVYVRLIRNVTPLGKQILSHIYGFKHYLKTAEVNRVAESNPVEAERIFCNFLPFAFGLGLGNAWMRKFEHVLSAAKLQELTEDAGGSDFISTHLTSSISDAASSRSSSSSSDDDSGSFGGGHSGGGSGGGGGGGW